MHTTQQYQRHVFSEEDNIIAFVLSYIRFLLLSLEGYIHLAVLKALLKKYRSKLKEQFRKILLEKKIVTPNEDENIVEKILQYLDFYLNSPILKDIKLVNPGESTSLENIIDEHRDSYRAIINAFKTSCDVTKEIEF